MTVTRLFSALALAAAGCVVTTGCGSGSDSPFTPSEGAIIQGTVANATGATASSASASASGIKVSVMGTALSTTTDSAGSFELSGVAAGNAVLHFEGTGIDAQLGVSGLLNGQVLTLNVQVSGSRATVSPVGAPSPSPRPSPSPSPDDEGEIGFKGTITSISAPNLVVAGRLVRTDGNTLIKRSGRRVPFSDLQVGQLVEVEGFRQPDGSVRARKISIEDDMDDDGDDDNGNHVSFKGQIQSITPPSLVVAGRTVVTTGSTRILDDENNPISLASLQAGQTVEVEGTPQADGSVLAKKVKLDD